MSVRGSASSATGSPGPSYSASARSIPSSPGASRRIAISEPPVVTSSIWQGGSHARQATERQEREAVREAEGEGDVEGARGEDRQLARRVEPRRQGVGLRGPSTQCLARGHDGAEEGRGPQGRSRDRAQELVAGK